MHRNRTWLLDPIELRTQRNRILPIEGGDGSTLSLDFTTGVLDPRLTFTRSTDATFINSSGLVQWANANIVRRSEDCTNWSGAQNIAPTADAAVAPNGTQTADQLNLLSTSYRYQVTTANKVIGGQRYTGSIYVRAVSGTAQVNLRIANTADGNNGVAVTQTVGETWTRLQGSFTLASNGTLIDIGLDQRTGIPNAGPGVAANVYVWGLQLQPGGTAGEYLQTTTTENYNTPRFDHDPTTGSPRGLLIEGVANNQVRNSNDIYNASFWGSSVGVSATQDTTIPDPSGGTTTCKIVKSAGIQYVVRNQPIPTLTVPANSTVNLTASVWLRMDGAGQVSPHLGIYDAAGASFGTRSGASVSNSAVTIDSGSAAIAAYTFGSVTGWVRCSVSRSFTNSTASPVTFTQLSIYIYPNQVNTNAATIYAWGAQVESGVGPSSLMPTGASQGNRAFDSCVMEDITSCNYSTKTGTLFYAGRFTQMNAASFPNRLGFTRETGDLRTFAALSTTTALLPCFANSGTSVLITNNITLNSELKLAFSFDADLATAEVKSSLNGGAIVQSGSSALTESSSPTYFMLGQKGYGAFFPHGTVRSVKYWPTALSTAQLQSLTT